MSDTKPFEISIGHNPIMDCYELQIFVGGFRDKQEAESWAEAFVNYVSTDYKRVKADA